MCLILSICFLNSDNEQSSLGAVINWAALTLTVLFAIVVKRENVLLIPMMVIAGMAVEAGKRGSGTRIKWNRFQMAVTSFCLCIGFTLSQLRLITTIESETAEFGTFPFNPTVFRTMLPLFAKWFLSLKLVSRYRDPRSDWISWVDLFQKARPLPIHLVHRVPRSVFVPRAQLLPVAKWRCITVRYHSLLHEFGRNLVNNVRDRYLVCDDASWPEVVFNHLSESIQSRSCAF